jgi:predicted choloylglycine hydrolase
MSTVAEYVIDLEQDESRRWAEVIEREQAFGRRVVQEAAAEFERVPEVLRRLFARLYRRLGGLYQGEIKAWAKGLGVSVGTATMLNCAYELSHLRVPRLFGCTAGVRWVEGHGMVHVRTLDWPLPSMAQATRLFRFRRGRRAFVSVGVPGQVGILSGMLPGAYSATINWAPPAATPNFEFGPGFFLREVLENHDSYETAVKTLTKTRLSTSVFFTVCGVEKRQACVIERSQRSAVVREMTGPALVQANHHVAKRFVKNNKALDQEEEVSGEAFSKNSDQRAAILEAALAQGPEPRALDELLDVLNLKPVRNEFTCQQMIFCPKGGVVKVWPTAAGAK